MAKAEKKDLRKSLYLSIAGFVIGFRFNLTEPPYWMERRFYEITRRAYPGFLVKTPIKVDHWIYFSVQTSFEVIIKGNEKYVYINFYKRISDKKTLTYYHISEGQFSVLLRDVIQSLIVKKKGLFIHASGALINNKACVFLGKSGAGKSTIARMISEKFSTLGDDSVILKQTDNHVFSFYQTPLFEKNIFIKRYSKEYPLGGLFFLKKSSSNKISRIISARKKTDLLTKQFLTDKKNLITQMPVLLRLAQTYRNFYIFEFSLENPKEVIKLLERYEQV